MNEKWVTKFKQWDVFSRFIMNLEALQIAMAITVVVMIVVIGVGGIIFAATVHNTGGQITWVLSIGVFFFKILLLEVMAVILLILIRIPLAINNLIVYIAEEWDDVKRQYAHVFKKDKD